MTLDLRPEIAQGLETLASAQGISVEAYLQRLVARELPSIMAELRFLMKAAWFGKMVCSSMVRGVPYPPVSLTTRYGFPARKNHNIFWIVRLEAIFRQFCLISGLL